MLTEVAAGLLWMTTRSTDARQIAAAQRGLRGGLRLSADESARVDGLMQLLTVAYAASEAPDGM